MSANDRPLLSESPWFWLLLFTLFALVLLLVFGNKYRQRQTQLERQFQSKELRDAREFEGRPVAETTKFSTPDDLIMPLWPLATLLTVLTIVSAGMLWRAWQRAVASARENPQ